MEDVGHAPGNSPFLKQLASSSMFSFSHLSPSPRADKISGSRARSDALDKLRQYLSNRSSFTHLEFLKLWKGLFYCVWHSDRPKAQQTLARDLAALTHVFRDDESKEQWIRAFWETMAREWAGIPALRMDKFLYLCRCYIGAGYEYAKRAGWELVKVEHINAIIKGIPLSIEYERPQMTNGLRLHVIDVWVDEIEKCREDGLEIPLDMLIKPLLRLQNKTEDKAIRNRAKEALSDERLKEWISDSTIDNETAPETDTNAKPHAVRYEDLRDEEDEERNGIDEG